jgi:hypothetical protein
MSEKTYPSIYVGKLDAARRQLETAIKLWFAGGDAVSIHTLVHAAYEIIHHISKLRNPTRHDLLLDSAVIKDEYRAQFAKLIKAPGNFFKHAKEDAEAVLEFRPVASEGMILFSILGVQMCGERLNEAESAYFLWLQLHRPDLLTNAGHQLINSFPANQIAELKSVRKGEFLDIYHLAWSQLRR